jgi:hypothetical protein
MEERNYKIPLSIEQHHQYFQFDLLSNQAFQDTPYHSDFLPAMR